MKPEWSLREKLVLAAAGRKTDEIRTNRKVLERRFDV